MITIKNNFHNSTARTRGGVLSERTVARIRKKLCGIGGCVCGGRLGERGPQTCEIEDNVRGLVVRERNHR